MTYREVTNQLWSESLGLSPAEADAAVREWEKECPPPCDLDAEITQEAAENYAAQYHQAMQNL